MAVITFKLFVCQGWNWKALASLSFFLNWRMIALRHCVSFCFITTWISYKYTHISIPFSVLPTALHTLPLSLITEYWSSVLRAASHQPSGLHMARRYANAPLSIHPIPSPPLCPQPTLYTCVSNPVLLASLRNWIGKWSLCVCRAGQNVYWWDKSTELSQIFLENDGHGKEDWLIDMNFTGIYILIKKQMLGTWFTQEGISNIDLNKWECIDMLLNRLYYIFCLA